MLIERFPAILELSREEKLQLLEELRDLIKAKFDDLPIPASHQKELNRRLQAHAEDPDSLLTFEELRERIERRK